MSIHVVALTRLFRALDRDQDGYLLASDLALLGRVMLGRPVSAQDARKELLRLKTQAEERIGFKRTFHVDALCLEEFIASGFALESMTQDAFADVVQKYVEAVARLTGTISQRELVILRMAKEQRNAIQATEDGARNRNVDGTSGASGSGQGTRS